MFPQIFGKYVLERLMAVGGMARVFLATLRGAGGFEKKLVVKQIRAELATDEAFVRRFVEEAKTTVELSHPNIVPVYELGVEQGVYYLAMELCDGATLAELVEKTGKLSPREAAYVGIEICRALDYAHRRAKIIHRDVTPRNVIVDEEGAVRLIDFGIAAPASAGNREVFGSPGHMPPEQLRGAELGPPADVFAVAALLYEAWSGRAPFRRETPEASERALSESVPRVSTIDVALAPLDGLMESALSLDPAARPQSAEDFSRPLRRFLAETDLGDLAKKLGARVAEVKTSSTTAPSESSDSIEHASSPDVTRTFATRPIEAADPKAAPVKQADVATRRMPEEGASWSTGSRARRARRSALWASVVIVAGAGVWAVTARQMQPAATATATTTATTTTTTTATAIPIASVVTTIAVATSGDAIDGSDERGNSAIEAPGHLRILANPQATVEVDGRARGVAPIADLPVAAGTHRVRLDCAPLGEAVSQNVRVEAGESVTISGDFTGPHGRILVRRGAANP